MNKFSVALLIGLVFSVFSFRPAPAPESSPREIMDKMLAAIDNAKTLDFHLKRKERFGAKYVTGELDAKVSESPRKVYLKNQYPDDGSEVLWIQGQNNGKALVSPNKFPYVNLNLDPHGSIMMNKQHHSVHELGFKFVKLIIQDALKKYSHLFDTAVQSKGMQTWNGRSCHVVEINAPEFSFKDYTVQAGEDLFDIARKFVVSEQIIMENNDKVDSFTDVKTGQVIKIPNVFAKKSVLYVDAELFLPIMQEVHDDKGLLERYEYSKLKVNPSFAANVFSDENEAYGF